MKGDFRILIAYDGSRFADSALDDLRFAGLPDEAEAVVICVAEVWLPPIYEIEKPRFVTDSLEARYRKNLEILADSQRLAESAAVRIGAAFPKWSVTAEATYGSPAWEILFRAEEFKPDLIVVGAQGVFGIAELLIGSVAQKIVTEAPCSVRVARGSVEVEPGAVRIVVGYDGTTGADQAVRAVTERSWPAASEAKVILVQDHAWIRNSFSIDDSHVEATGHGVVERLRAAGIDASLLICDGNPKHVIVEEARKWGADTIFLGATKFNDALTKYLLGSVASAIVTRAGCSVEVVRPSRT